jgi:small-conductance mechanosensitive channel
MRLLRFLTLCLVLVAGLAGTVSAQDAPDYESWDAAARRAEAAVETAQASDAALEQLRGQLAERREEFRAAQQTNSAAIAAVTAQIAALGPKPAEGEEPPETARQRAELNTRLNDLKAPVQRAEVAYSRADALIQQIDRIMRERQATELLEISPSPINPVNWPPAVEALVQYVYRTGLDVQENWQKDTRRAVYQRNLPVSVGLLLLAVVLVLRGRHWVELLVTTIQKPSRTAERWLAGFVMSLGQIVLPVVGLILLTLAATLTGLLGTRGDVLMQSIPAGGFAFFAARWLGGRMFPRDDQGEPLLALSPAQRIEGRFHASLLGFVLLLNAPLEAMAGQAEWSPVIVNVLTFPLMVVAAVSMVRLGRLLMRHSRAGTGEGAEPDFRTRIVALLSRAIIIVPVVGIALASVGYFNAGRALVFPPVATLMLLGLLVVLQKLVQEIYVLFSRNREGVNEALTPVLAGFVLAMASLPLFALIWGARMTDLSEIWDRFTAGFSVGETRISPTDFMTFILVFGLCYLATRLLQSALRSQVLPKTRLDPGGQNAVTAGVGYIGIFAAGLIAVTSAGVDLSALAFVAGALSLGIGFGLQNIVQNFVSGIILLIERPIAIGDWIEVNGQMGYVRDISVRSTRIETFDRTDVIVPNADFVSGTVTNWTRGNLVGRIIVPVGVAYGSDTRQVEQILREVAEAQPMVLLNPAPFVLFKGFGADSVDFEVRAILRDVTSILAVQTEMNHQIYERFNAAGIQIPFAQRDIWLRNPEALHAPVAPPANPAPGPAAGAAAMLDAGDLPEPDGPEQDGNDGDGDR